MDDLKDKIAVVTGGGSGLGRAMAHSFADRGTNCVLAEVDDEAAEKVAGELSAKGVKAITAHTDVRGIADVEALADKTFSEFGGVDIVCNNAGVGVGGMMHDHTTADWDWIMGVNLRGVTNGIQAFVPRMIEQGRGGHIVNTASMAGMISGLGLGAYCMTKFGVVALTEALQQELVGFNIGASVLCPGFVKTRIYDSGRNRPDDVGGAESGEDNPLFEITKGFVDAGIEPEIVGERVAQAILDNDLYIFTHPDMKPLVEARFNNILAAFDKAAEIHGLDQSSPVIWPGMDQMPDFSGQNS